MTCSASVFWHPIASTVTVAPSKSSISSSFGIALISLLFPSTAHCANTQRAWLAKALSRCTGPSLPREPRNVSQLVQLVLRLPPRVRQVRKIGLQVGQHSLPPFLNIAAYLTPCQHSAIALKFYHSIELIPVHD